MNSDSFDPYRKWLGISERDRPPNHYRLLGLVLFEDDADVIQNAADRQMLHVKSMAGGKLATVAQQLLNELSGARACLLVQVTKAAYDLQLRGKLSATELMQPDGSGEAVQPPPIATTAAASFADAATPVCVAIAFPRGRSPNTIGSWAPPVSGTTVRAQSKRRTRRAENWVTVTVCLLLILGLGIGTFLFRDQLFGVDDSSQPSRKDSIAANVPAKSERTASSADELHQEVNPAAVEPIAVGPAIDPEIIRNHLWEARKALSQRKPAIAKSRLEEAAALIETQPPELAEELSADLKHWRRAHEHLETFWSGVREAVRGRLPLGQSHNVGEDEVRLLGGDSDVVTYLLNGSQSLGEVDGLPARVAVVLASKGLEGDAEKLISAIATFVLLDRNALADGPPREVFERLMAETAGEAEPDLTVERLLQESPLEAQRAANEPVSKDVEVLLNARSPPSGVENLAAIDPLELIDRAAIRAAKVRLRTEQKDRIARAARDRMEAVALVKALVDSAEQSLDEPTRCAHLELAMETAAAACLPAELPPLADAFGATSGQNPDVIKHFYLARCKPRSAAQAKSLYEEAQALMERAELLREHRLALKFWEVAALAAHATKDLGLQQALVKKRLQLEAAAGG